MVAKNPHHLLSSLYGKTLRALAQMPETAAYRVNTEKIIRDRAAVVATVWIFITYKSKAMNLIQTYCNEKNRNRIDWALLLSFCKFLLLKSFTAGKKLER